jgi:RHS repeat-associated protein
LSVNNTVIATASYGDGSTPSTIAASLAAAVGSSAPVTVTAVDDTLNIVAISPNAASDLSFSVQNASYNHAFSQPSFPASIIYGNLDGGADANTNAGTTIYSYQGNYDGVGNVVSYTDNGSGGQSNGIMGTWSFTYDSLNRLATANAAANAPAPYAGNYGCWSYDSFGNRLSQSMSTTACGSSPPPLMSWANYTVDGTPNTPNNGKNQITGTANGLYQYDASGDVINDGLNQYLYDAEGRICAVASTPMPSMTAMTGYLYDADGTRVAKGSISVWSCDPTVNGFQTTSDYILGPKGEQVTEMGVGGAASSNSSDGTTTSGLAWQHTNVYAGSSLIATYDNDGLHFYFNDPLGTRRAQTDSAGVLEQTCSSLPFGDALNCSGGNLTAPTEHHFTGKERDTESGNDYFGARYYSSAMGRFMSPDDFWKDTNLADPQSLNKYAYARNNPLRYIDPTGETATMTTTCSTATTCTTTITASIAIYAAPESGITNDQMNQAASTITSSIDKAWSGSYTNDAGVTFTVKTDVSVFVVSDQATGEKSGAQNVIGLTNGPANDRGDDNANVRPGRNVGQDEGKWNFNTLDRTAPHEFTHLLGVDDRRDFSLVLSNTMPFRRPMPLHATSQDFGWALKETSTHINAAMEQMKKTGTSFSPVKDVTTVGQDYGPWK